jgi:hypothetical protein
MPFGMLLCDVSEGIPVIFFRAEWLIAKPIAKNKNDNMLRT